MMETGNAKQSFHECDSKTNILTNNHRSCRRLSDNHFNIFLTLTILMTIYTVGGAFLFAHLEKKHSENVIHEVLKVCNAMLHSKVLCTCLRASKYILNKKILHFIKWKLEFCCLHKVILS